MARVERITVDVTVARDLLDPTRARHEQAAELFALARAGVIELRAAPQGVRLDVQGDLARAVEQAFVANAVEELPQLAYPSSVTYPGKNLFPGAYVKGLGEAWDAVLGSWRSHEGKPPQSNDRWHVETHLLSGADVFITDDGPLLVMCRRIREEHGFTVVAMGLGEYLQGRGTQ